MAPQVAQALSPHQLPPTEVQQITDIVGIDVRAAAVAKFSAEPHLDVDVPALLAAASLESAFGNSLRRRIGLWPNLDVKRSATLT